MRIVLGLSGFARSGKNTIADYLCEKYGYTQIGFADEVKRALYELNPDIVDELGSDELQFLVDRDGWEETKKVPKVRQLLQRMGTEVGRNIFGEDVWVNLAKKKTIGLDKVVFSDVRFQNEVGAVRFFAGFDRAVVWNVTREGVGGINSHSSENGIDPEFVDLEIKNDSTIEHLKEMVDYCVQEYNL